MAKYAGKKKAKKKYDRMKEKKLKALYYNIMIRYLSSKGRRLTTDIKGNNTNKDTKQIQTKRK